jgi:16S rRNA processing protein RimM
MNREGVALGCVRDTVATGLQSVLCVEYFLAAEGGAAVAAAERMIPLSVYVDSVDIAGKLITVDWQPTPSSCRVRMDWRHPRFYHL